MKFSNVKKLINGLLHNKLVLYATAIFTLVNIFGYMMMNCTYTIAFFALTAFVTSMFTKNMIIILGGSLAITNTFMVCKVVKENFADGYVEGFKGKGKKEGMKEGNEEDKKESMKEDNEQVVTEGVDTKQEQMTVGYKKDNRLDYAATVEEAYDDLDKILGADGIKNLTNDTEKLVKQQQQLAGLMKNMGPMVGQVKEMMQSMGGSEGMQQMMGKLSSKIGGQ